MPLIAVNICILPLCAYEYGIFSTVFSWLFKLSISACFTGNDSRAATLEDCSSANLRKSSKSPMNATEAFTKLLMSATVGTSQETLLPSFCCKGLAA